MPSSALDTTSEADALLAAAFRLMKDRDGDLSSIFGNDSRSTAFIRMLALRSRSLLTDEEFARFSAETRDSIDNALGGLR